MALFYPTTNTHGTFGASTESPRWCDAFGPFELPCGPDSRTGVGPFLMKVKRRNKIKNNTVMLICEFERREGGCPAYAYVTQKGQLLGRRGLHNHSPLRDYPQCAPGSLSGLASIPAPPTFAEASALLRDPRRRKQWFRQQPAAPAPSTSIPIPDPETGAMIETEITAANVLEISRYAEKRETINGEIRLACPVPGCTHVSKKGGIYKHLRMLHMNLPDRGSGDLSFCDEKLCPLCKQDKVTHEDLIRHIVHDHDTRLECTEHEFESEDDFKKWKERTEQEEMSSFALRSGKNRAPLGTYICCRAGRKHRRSPLSRLLGFECPASMVVERRNNRLYVWFWRTHIGHRPAVVDVTLSSKDRVWVKECILNKMNNRDIILQGMSGYLGGNPRRVHLLDSQDIENIVRHFDLKELRGDIKSKHFKNEDLRKVRLARYIKRTMGNDKPMEAALNRAYHNESQPKRSMVQDHLTGFHTVTGEDESDRGIVFPRRSGHRECDHICDFCNVCVHRYGCTCSAFMCDGLMCDHIHTVAMLAGVPGDEWLDPMLCRETFGLDEALIRLARMNYKERLEKMVPLLDEFVALVRGDQHQMDLDKLQELLDSGIAMVKACPKPPLTLDDEAPADALATYKEPDLFDFADDELTLPAPKSTSLTLKVRPSGTRTALIAPLAGPSTASSIKPDTKLARVAGVALSTTSVQGVTRPLANIPRAVGPTKAGAGAGCELVRPTYSRRANRLGSAVRMTRISGSVANTNDNSKPTMAASKIICSPVAATTRPVGVRMIRLPSPRAPAVTSLSTRTAPTLATSRLSSIATTGTGGPIIVPTRLVVPLPQLLAAGLRPGSVAIVRKGLPSPGAVLVRGPSAPILIKATRLPLSETPSTAIVPAINKAEPATRTNEQLTENLTVTTRTESTLRTLADRVNEEELDKDHAFVKSEEKDGLKNNTLQEISSTSSFNHSDAISIGRSVHTPSATQFEYAAIKREGSPIHMGLPDKKARLEMSKIVNLNFGDGQTSSMSWDDIGENCSTVGNFLGTTDQSTTDSVISSSQTVSAREDSRVNHCPDHQSQQSLLSQESESPSEQIPHMKLNTAKVTNTCDSSVRHAELPEVFYQDPSPNSCNNSRNSFTSTSGQNVSTKLVSNGIQPWSEALSSASVGVWNNREQPVSQNVLNVQGPWPEDSC
ncbi:uncharacterized protein LOC111243777 isoform X2 [Varroa destructor]|nr:uncharacterized protein LOC111243777 isoform X2 [Varroa destructor]XP_022645585.1 uncharacterized protein LOC111243777 isoform X2 [Varroa destructor]XP_022645586.1 uncharacterized protein LOC111243777 isoform X2 [Varroa destructor]